jgi:hypothetical protein
MSCRSIASGAYHRIRISRVDRVPPWLSSEVREIVFAPFDGPEAVVPALMRRVVARLAEYDAVIHVVRSSELDVSNVMGLSALAVTVVWTSRVAKMRDRSSTTRTPIVLTGESELLCRPGELVWSRHRNPSIISFGCPQSEWGRQRTATRTSCAGTNPPLTLLHANTARS